SYVVNTSSAGAQLDNAGPISGLGTIERRLNEVAENVIHLRPGFFMENFLQQLESMKRDGASYDLIPGDIPYPFIATQDISDVAAALLLETKTHVPSTFRCQRAGSGEKVSKRTAAYCNKHLSP